MTTKKYYETQMVLDQDQVIEIREDRDTYEYNGAFGQIGFITGGRSFNILVKGYTLREVPGKELKALIDLGYTEEQGVQMLKCIEPAGNPFVSSEDDDCDGLDKCDCGCTG